MFTFTNSLTRSLRCDPLTPGTPFTLGADSPLAHSPRAVKSAHFSYVSPTRQPSPNLISLSAPALSLLSLPDRAAIERDSRLKLQLLNVFSGNSVPSGTNPWSLNYGGHQFGSWAGQLGDGRAITIGEISLANSSRSIELQLKGAGPTPYSRFADGYAVLRSSIREYLAAEAMHALNVPTSRSLSLVATGTRVLRENGGEQGAVVGRLAETWIRFGSFEGMFANGEFELLKELADYTIEKHFPEVVQEISSIDPSLISNSNLTPTSPNKYILWIKSVITKTAHMIAHWQSIGFCHGVMNTDNFSILGLTIDYGPFQFMNAYDSGYVCNHSDETGRYAFNRQPSVGLWNLVRLCNVLDVLLARELPAKGSAIPKDEQTHISSVLTTLLHSYSPQFHAHYAFLMSKKLGLVTEQESDREALITPLLQLLETAEMDYTLFFRSLSQHIDEIISSKTIPDFLWTEWQKLSFIGPGEWDGLRQSFESWTLKYKARLESDGGNLVALKQRMLQSNPRYVLRNHIVQKVIDEVERDNGSNAVDRYLALLLRPFEDGSVEEWREFGGVVPSELRDIKCSCSS